MRLPKANAPSGVYVAFLRVLVALRHQSRLHASPSGNPSRLGTIHHLLRGAPSRLRKLPQYITFAAQLEDIELLPRIKFFGFRGLFFVGMLRLFFRQQLSAQQSVAFSRNPC